MTTKYKCVRCGFYEKTIFSDIKKHLNRKNVCNKTNDSIFMSNDQLLVLSLIPYHNNTHSISHDDILHLQNSNIIDKNKKELFDEIDKIEKNKLKHCKYCNTEFPLIMDLKKHIILNCFFNELEKRNKMKNNSTIINTNIDSDNPNGLYNNCDNINNTHIQTLNNNSNNNNNNINIFVDLNKPVPFDEEWDLSKINEDKKERLTFSKTMYTNFLTEILKNDMNLNVVMDNENNDYGMVYKNNSDKYIQMKSTDIVEKTMKKLNYHLNEINKNNTESFEDITKFSRQMINKKYIDYQKNEYIHKSVDEMICFIYGNKKVEATHIAKKVLDNYDRKKNGF
jgi:hypothetical protein